MEIHAQFLPSDSATCIKEKENMEDNQKKKKIIDHVWYCGLLGDTKSSIFHVKLQEQCASPDDIFEKLAESQMKNVKKKTFLCYLILHYVTNNSKLDPIPCGWETRF